MTRDSRSAARVSAATFRSGLSQAFAGEFALRGVLLPLASSTDPKEIGVLRDARGRVVLVVDVESRRTNQEAAALAALIAEAVNSRAAS